MAIPDVQTIMLPLLNLASDGKARSLSESRDALSGVFKLSEAGCGGYYENDAK